VASSASSLLKATTAWFGTRAGASKSSGLLRDFSVRSKLLSIILATSLLSLGIITYLAYQTGKNALTEAAFNQLTSVRSAKKQQVEWYFHNMRQTFGVFGDDASIISAFKDLNSGYQILGPTPLSPEKRRELQKYYSDDFIPKLAKGSNQANFAVEDFWPVLESAREAQHLFIVQNPHKTGEKGNLITHAVENPYTVSHSKNHKWLKDVANKYAFYDLFLIDAETGAMVYSVAKESDFATSLTLGPYSSSSLGRLVRDIIKSPVRGQTRITDFSLYAPSYNAPAAFIGVPIFEGAKLLGVFAGQISTEALGSFLHGNRTWREQGLGETGGSYLVGPDLLMRSDNREILEKPETYLAQIKAARIVPDATIDKMTNFKTTTLYYPINNEPVKEALKGNSGTMLVRNRRGIGALASYAPLVIPDLNWVIISRMDESEVLKSQIEFNRTVMTVACLLALFASIAGLLLARYFLKPITALLGGIESLRKGDATVQLEQTSRDEFGTLTGAFNSMAREIKSRDEIIQSKSKAYETLLRRIFPDTVAERLQKGEGQIAETFTQVSIIYILIDGFTNATEELSDTDAINLLNELVDGFDECAERHGIDKVKTIGDQYLAACGLSTPRLDHVSRAMEFARAAMQYVFAHNQRHGTSLSLRIGIASGQCHAGLVGNRRFVYDIWGTTVAIARRIVFDAGDNAVRVHEDVYNALADKAGFGDMLEVTTKAKGPVKTWQHRFTRTAIANDIPVGVSAPKAAE
jgi:class 3 adenylate cyclase